jgi:hypothetical protein
MQQIGCILDIEAFSYNGTHLIKELGIILVYDKPIFNYKFKLPIRFAQLSDKARRSAIYCTNFIHGMRFENTTSDLKYAECKSILLNIQDQIEWNGFKYIAYKGGIIERKLLNSLHIPCVDLEKYGCPRFTELLNDYELTRAVQCNAHRFAKPGIAVHCPNIEISLFKTWLQSSKF